MKIERGAIAIAIAVTLPSLYAVSQETLSPIEFAEAQAGVDLTSVEITVETLRPGLHVLFGAGGNIGVSIGEQGVLIVDDQYSSLVPKVQAVIRDLGGGDVDLVVNTHWHFDHSFGNPLFAGSGSLVISQENSREMMLSERIVDLVNVRVRQPASAAISLPGITYDDRMSLHFNGQRIDLLHFGAAHTTGDTAVIFRGDNVVHLGDIFNNWGYPFIDAGNGGGFEGVLKFLEGVLNEINEDTVVIPGHGAVAEYDDLVEYTRMLSQIHDRIAALVAEGASLEEVIAARPTADWDATEGDPTRLLNRAYLSMTRD